MMTTPIPCRFPAGPLLREPADLDVPNLASEEVIHVSGARVAVAEYEVLQHDFPELQTENLTRLNPHLRALSTEERRRAVQWILDEWLIANAAFVSTSQAAEAVVNTPIYTDGRRIVAYRPPKYGRAVVVPTSTEAYSSPDGSFDVPGCKGMLDLKGVGVSPDRIPSSRPESSGLEYLGMALSDFLVKKAIDEIFARELPTVSTVPVYAVLDLGFDTNYRKELGTGPAGLHVRRAHRRRLEDQASAVEHEATFDIEVALRRYGVTAATIGFQHTISRDGGRLTQQRGRFRPTPITDPAQIGVSLALLGDRDQFTFDWRDVQLAREVGCSPARAQMVDFGAIRILPTFENPVMRDYGRGLLDSLIWPGAPAFPTADPTRQLPEETWRRHALAIHYLRVARQFREGVISRRDVREDIDGRLRECIDRWPAPVRPSLAESTL